MLSNFFNYDNPVWRFIGKFFDVMVLNLLWVFLSIPIVTIGASTTAVYYVTMKLAQDEDSSVFQMFFKSFRENFKQATAIWLIFLGSGLLLGLDLYFFFRMQTAPSGFRTIMIGLLLTFSVIWLLMLLFVFPLQAKFYNPVKRTLMNGFFMSIRHIGYSLLMLLIDGVLVYITVTVPVLLSLGILFGFPLLAFFHSFFLVRIFDRYIPKTEPEHEDGDFWELPEETGDGSRK